MGRKVLIIDDSNDIADAMQEIVQMQGYEAEVALTAYDAIDLIEASPPDLIILDLKLPDMDGVELAKRIKSRPASARVPIVCVSSYLAGREVEARAAGCIELYSKTTFIESYPAMLKRFLGEATAASG